MKWQAQPGCSATQSGLALPRKPLAFAHLSIGCAQTGHHSRIALRCIRATSPSRNRQPVGWAEHSEAQRGLTVGLHVIQPNLRNSLSSPPRPALSAPGRRGSKDSRGEVTATPQVDSQGGAMFASRVPETRDRSIFRHKKGQIHKSVPVLKKITSDG